MIEVRFSSETWRQLQEGLLSRLEVESKCFIFCRTVERGEDVAFLARQLVVVPPGAYEIRTGGLIEVKREYVHHLLLECARNDFSLVEAHSHPFARNVSFSSIDMRSDAEKFKATQGMLPPFRHAALVFGSDMSFQGHTWHRQRQEMLPVQRIKVLQSPILLRYATDCPQNMLAEARREVFDRQIRALGEAGQRMLSQMTVAVVGAGGLGSAIANLLMLLGVGHLILIDPDRLEASNANRMFLVTRNQIERRWKKVKALARQAPYTGWGYTKVTAVDESVLDSQVWNDLAWADVIVGATDSARARQVLNAIAVSCLVPFIDGGVGIRARDGRIEDAGGQVRLVLPGCSFCLDCLGTDAAALSEETLSEEEREMRRQAGYIIGEQVKNPQVAHLNMTIASLLVSEVTNLLTGILDVKHYIYWDLPRRMAFPVEASRRPSCLTCGSDQLLAGGLEMVKAVSVSRAHSLPANIPSPSAAQPQEEEARAEQPHPSRGRLRFFAEYVAKFLVRLASKRSEDSRKEQNCT